MSTATAKRIVYERLASLGVALIAVHLPLDPVPTWADAVDDQGQTIRLIGRHALGESAEAHQWLEAVLADLRRGDLPERVLPIKLEPRAAEAFATITHRRLPVRPGRALEILVDGGRQSGKTVMGLTALAELGEQRRRARLDVLKTMWCQDTLKSATEKTGASMQEDLWGGVWSLREDRQLAVLTVGGAELCHVRFVGAADAEAAERLRASCHALVIEEAIPSLETGGVSPRQYGIALSSLLRMPTPRRVAITLTNPGGPESWVFKKWLTPTHEPECIRVPVPGEDRLTPDQLAAQAAAFGYAPDLAARLGRGEWCDLILGPQVAVGFDPLIHVAKAPIEIMQGLDFWLGWDSGQSHCHALTIGQRNGGRRNVLAALVRENCGLKQFLELDVVPWFRKFAPWALTIDGRFLIHRYDPSMNGFSGADSDLVPIEQARRALGGGHYLGGPTAWPDREGPMLSLFAEGDGRGGPALQVDPSCTLLIQTLTTRWYYQTTKGGQVIKDGGPYKPNRPWEDLGDSFAYWCFGVAPSRQRPRHASGSKKTSIGVYRSLLQ